MIVKQHDMLTEYSRLVLDFLSDGFVLKGSNEICVYLMKGDKVVEVGLHNAVYHDGAAGEYYGYKELKIIDRGAGVERVCNTFYEIKRDAIYTTELSQVVSIRAKKRMRESYRAGSLLVNKFVLSSTPYKGFRRQVTVKSYEGYYELVSRAGKSAIICKKNDKDKPYHRQFLERA